MTEQIITNQHQLDSYYLFLKSKLEKEGAIKVNAKSAKQRTLTQNRALHKYFSMLADELNNAGYDFRTFIKDGIAVPFTPDLVKEYIWRPVQRAVLQTESTTEADTVDYSQVYDVLNMHLITNKNIFVQWPDRHGPQI